MDRLSAGEQLNVNDELVSSNGRVRLVLQSDGNLVLYRTQTRQPLWASDTYDQPVTRAVMQADGNFVAYTADGDPRWASGTDGNPGAWVVVQDDGNVVVYDSSKNPLWATNTVLNWNWPTIGYKDARATHTLRSPRPGRTCALTFLASPRCSGPVLDARPRRRHRRAARGHPSVEGVVPGIQDMPGGVGAEVGVYRRIPGRAGPTSLPFLPPAVEGAILNAIASLTDEQLWWPAPELNAQLEFTLINPVTDEPFFSAGPQTSYWLAAWMNEPSYIKYSIDQGFRIPFFPNDYMLEYRINGRTRRRPSTGLTPPSH